MNIIVFKKFRMHVQKKIIQNGSSQINDLEEYITHLMV